MVAPILYNGCVRVGILGMLSPVFSQPKRRGFCVLQLFRWPHPTGCVPEFGSGAGSTSGFAIPRRWNQPKKCWLGSALGGRVHTVLFLFFACFVARYSRTWLARAKRLPENRFQIPQEDSKRLHTSSQDQGEQSKSGLRGGQVHTSGK